MKRFKSPGIHEIYDKLTAQLLERMDEGVTPWVQGWQAKGPARSVSTEKTYRGFNQLVLQAIGERYESPYWLTYNQAQALGGTVKKGEKGTPVIFWKILKGRGAPGSEGAAVEDGNDGDGEPAERSVSSGGGRSIPLLRYYTVFNADQCEGLKTDLDLHPGRLQKRPTPNEAHKAAQGVVDRADMCPVKTTASIAAYSPSRDEVLLPPPERFENLDDFYQVAFHELAHATGHKTRLGRLDRSADATADMRLGSYSKEELVAEMSAAYLCNLVGLDMERVKSRSAAYLKHWAAKCRQEPELLINAAQQAQKATDWVLGLTPELQKRRAEKEGTVYLQPPGAGSRAPLYQVEEHRPFHAGDVVRYFQPGTPNFDTGILTGETERNYTIAGLIDLPKSQVFSLATKEQANAKDLYVALIEANQAAPDFDPDDQEVLNTPESVAALTAAKWSHLNLVPMKDPVTQDWVCRKMKGYPVQNVAAPVDGIALYVGEDPAYEHKVEGDQFMGQLHSREVRADLYFTKRAAGIEVAVRTGPEDKDCIRCNNPDGMADVFAIAHDRAHQVIENQKARAKEAELATSAPEM